MKIVQLKKIKRSISGKTTHRTLKPKQNNKFEVYKPRVAEIICWDQSAKVVRETKR